MTYWMAMEPMNLSVQPNATKEDLFSIYYNFPIIAQSTAFKRDKHPHFCAFFEMILKPQKLPHKCLQLSRVTFEPAGEIKMRESLLSSTAGPPNFHPQNPTRTRMNVLQKRKKPSGQPKCPHTQKHFWVWEWKQLVKGGFALSVWLHMIKVIHRSSHSNNYHQ